MRDDAELRSLLSEVIRKNYEYRALKWRLGAIEESLSICRPRGDAPWVLFFACFAIQVLGEIADPLEDHKLFLGSNAVRSPELTWRLRQAKENAGNNTAQRSVLDRLLQQEIKYDSISTKLAVLHGALFITTLTGLNPGFETGQICGEAVATIRNFISEDFDVLNYTGPSG